MPKDDESDLIEFKSSNDKFNKFLLSFSHKLLLSQIQIQIPNATMNDC